MLYMESTVWYRRNHYFVDIKSLERVNVHNYVLDLKKLTHEDPRGDWWLSNILREKGLTKVARWLTPNICERNTPVSIKMLRSRQFREANTSAQVELVFPMFSSAEMIPRRISTRGGLFFNKFISLVDVKYYQTFTLEIIVRWKINDFIEQIDDAVTFPTYCTRLQPLMHSYRRRPNA